jgi:ribosomal protein S18 acetylase RimI-like enzyme
MTLRTESLAEMGMSDLASLFNRAFTGYIGGTVNLDTMTMAGVLARENVDLTQSLLLLDDDQPAGFALIARQGWTSRVAAMGIVPEAQEKRHGTWFMEQVIQAAKERGDKTIVLEAYEQNVRAVRLYERSGFRIVRRLYGYTASDLTGAAHPDLSETDIYETAKQIVQHGRLDLPWQVSGMSIARLTPPSRAFRLGDAFAVISDPSRDTIVIRGIIVSPVVRHLGQGTQLIRALAASYPGKKWSVIAIWPEEYASFFERCGFSRNELNQVQMEAALT